MCKCIILYSIVWLVVEQYLLLSKDRIVPPDPITSSERRSTLLRLNQVIQHRLVTGNLLPQMRNLKVIIRHCTSTCDNCNLMVTVVMCLQLKIAKFTCQVCHICLFVCMQPLENC